MIRIASFAILIVAVSAQFQNFANQQFTSTTPAPIHPPAQVHYVNIGQDLAGDYKFGYDTGKGPLGQSFREESRGPDGTVKGAYGYVDASGQQRIVRYTAGKDGFMIDADEPAANAAPKANLATVQPTRAPAPTFQSFPQVPPTRFQHPPAPAIPAAPAPTAAPALQAQPAPRPAPLQLPALPQQNPASVQFGFNPASAHAGVTSAAAAAAAVAAPQPATNPAALTFQNFPQAQPAQAFRPQALPAAPTYQSRPLAAAQPQFQPQYQPSAQANAGQYNALANFIQLPGTRLIQINPRRSQPQPQAAQPNFASNNVAATSFASQGANIASTPAPEEYNGPVVINAALLSYDIGSARRTQNQ